MAVRGKKQSVDDGALRALLERYACPIPYHQVRARLMGNIATPELSPVERRLAVPPLQLARHQRLR